MSNELVRAILAIVVGAHGIGHVLFLLPVLGVVDWGQSTRSWLLSDEGLMKVVGAVIWAAATLGFIAAAIGIFGQQSWWRAVAVVASVISLAGLALFWKNPPTQPVIAAAIFDVIVLAALLVFRWPPSSLVGP